jgi:urease accessory protein
MRNVMRDKMHPLPRLGGGGPKGRRGRLTLQSECLSNSSRSNASSIVSSTPSVADYRDTSPETGEEGQALYRLLAWLSPAYPIGAFSYSHGVETAVEEGFITDRVSLVAWLETVLCDGTGRVDGALFAAAWRAADATDWPAFEAIAERAAAWRGTSEMALESRQQGGSFLSITRTAWPHPDLEAVGDALALPVAVALAAAAHGIALEAALGGYLHAFTANLISAAVRTVPLGQSDGQRALAGLEGAVRRTVDAALAVSDLDDVGTATPLLDWCSLRHETQYTRLFRS